MLVAGQHCVSLACQFFFHLHLPTAQRKFGLHPGTFYYTCHFARSVVIIQLQQRDLLGRRDIFECCGFRLVSRFEALAVKRVMLSTATAVTARMAQYDPKNERTPGRRYCRSGEGFCEFVVVLRFIISTVIFFLRKRGTVD
jgi:hypothetical protein